ncbi:YRDC family protein [Megaselia abdita]
MNMQLKFKTFKMFQTQIFKINSEKPSVDAAERFIREGSVIALPTDTVYGLACDASNACSVKALYDIKGRDDLKPVAICVADLKSFKFWGNAEHLSDELLNYLLPGPVTIVVEKSENLHNPYLNTGTSKLGIRIPNFAFIQNLCQKLNNRPLALTSANRSSEPSSLSISEFKELWPKLPAIFDYGKIGLTEENRLASTVIDLSEPGRYTIIREGVAGFLTRKCMKTFNILEK